MQPQTAPEDELPAYLTDEPPLADPDAPSAGIDTAQVETLSTPKHVTKASTPGKAPVVQMPGTAPKPGGKHGQPKRKAMDLERMSVQYGAGVMTLREIATEHGCTQGRVCQIAKAKGWTRDLRERARIQSAALANDPERMALLRADMEKARDAKGHFRSKPGPVANAILGSQAQASALAASVQPGDAIAGMAMIRTAHRDLILTQRRILGGLLLEVEQAARGEDLDQLLDRIERELADDPSKAVEFARKAINRVTALPSRVYGINKLSVAAKNVIAMERQAFDLDAPDEGKAPPPKDNTMSPSEIFAWMAAQRPQ